MVILSWIVDRSIAKAYSAQVMTPELSVNHWLGESARESEDIHGRYARTEMFEDSPAYASLGAVVDTSEFEAEMELAS